MALGTPNISSDAFANVRLMLYRFMAASKVLGEEGGAASANVLSEKEKREEKERREMSEKGQKGNPSW